MSKNFKIAWRCIFLSLVIIFIFFVISCEGPTGGDFERPYVTFLNIDQSGEGLDDSLFFSTEIRLTAGDNEELEKVELYIFNLDPSDSSKILPIKTFTGDPPYSYMWETDTGVGFPSGQYKILAGVWDKVGYYYQEFRTVLLRGDSSEQCAVLGVLTDATGTPLEAAQVSLINSEGDTLAKNTGVSSSGGNYRITSVSVTEKDTSVYTKANYVTDSELYTIYDDNKINMVPRKTYTIDFGANNTDQNFDYLNISNISHSLTQVVTVDTSTGKSDSVTFQFDYNAWVSTTNVLTPDKNAWLIISADNDEVTDSTASAINLGSIGFDPGVTGSVIFNIKAPNNSFPNDIFTIYAALIDYATSETNAFDIYNKHYYAENRIIKIGKIKIQWK